MCKMSLKPRRRYDYDFFRIKNKDMFIQMLNQFSVACKCDSSGHFTIENK